MPPPVNTIGTCRVCGDSFFSQPLLRYEGMPKAAQFLPDAESLAKDGATDLEVCQCSGCGLVQLNSDPVPYYREVIRAAGVSAEMKAFRLGQFGSFVRDHALGGKKVIEIGCGRGEYLSLLQEVGAEAYGLENSDEAVVHCGASGLKVAKGFVSGDCRLPHAPFAAFCMLNFLEHLPEPNATLRGIRNNLTDAAVGLVEVPNFDMIIKKNLFSEFISDHLFYFTQETLRHTLTVNGFEVIACSTVWHDYIVSATVRKRRPQDLKHFDAARKSLKDEIAGFIARFDPGSVAVWGAGHQALAVLALTDLSGKIRYVIDSAPFKQGKYTPATHIPIVAPEKLLSEPVDAVIVMAAAYSDEIAAILRRDYNPGIEVAILRDFGLQLA